MKIFIGEDQMRLKIIAWICEFQNVDPKAVKKLCKISQFRFLMKKIEIKIPR